MLLTQYQSAHLTTDIDHLSLRRGDIVSLSAGHGNPNSIRGRIASHSGDPLESLSSLWPELASWIGPSPVAIQAYPAHIGQTPSAISIDSYLRPINIARGIYLAATIRSTACIIAQPLFAAHAVMSALASNTSHPSKLLVALGGYTCPASLESFLMQHTRSRGIETRIIHAYGVSEIGPAILLGVRTNERKIAYKKRYADMVLTGKGRHTIIQNANTTIEPGDDITDCGDHYIVHQSHERLSPRIVAELETWGEKEWLTRTGYIQRQGDRLTIQLREGADATTGDEIDYFHFARQHGMSWLDKPKWG